VFNHIQHWFKEEKWSCLYSTSYDISLMYTSVQPDHHQVSHTSMIPSPELCFNNCERIRFLFQGLYLIDFLQRDRWAVWYRSYQAQCSDSLESCFGCQVAWQQVETTRQFFQTMMFVSLHFFTQIEWSTYNVLTSQIQGGTVTYLGTAVKWDVSIIPVLMPS